MSNDARKKTLDDIQWAMKVVDCKPEQSDLHPLVGILLKQLNFHRLMGSTCYVESHKLHGDGCVDLQVGLELSAHDKEGK